MAHQNYYHYTTLKGLIGILETGEIKLAIDSITHKKEKPVAWISTNDFWEPTATKVMRSLSGKIYQLTFEEQAIHFGCARIQVIPNKLLTWGKLKHVARMNLTNAFLMEQVQGAEPKNWYGSLQPIRREHWIKVEVYKDNQWVEITPEHNIYSILHK